jgi:hypothetical protein
VIGPVPTSPVESQCSEHRPNSIQYLTIALLRSESPAWDIMIDDDGKGEIADIVATRIDTAGID